MGKAQLSPPLPIRNLAPRFLAQEVGELLAVLKMKNSKTTISLLCGKVECGI
jgi:hypothetical protein